MKILNCVVVLFWSLNSIVSASEDIKDKYPQSELYNKPVEVIPNVFSAIGATAPPTYENSGHNNNLSFVITTEGVVVINSGASVALASALHDEIKNITDRPVKLVINENGQGHAILGNLYWSKLGIDILAHEDAIHEIEENSHSILERMKSYNGDKAVGTKVIIPNKSFSEKFIFTLGDLEFHVLHLGPAHGPGDTQVWLPQLSLIIAGDMAFHERMLPIFEDTCTKCWLETWNKEFAPLNATYVIPGHGHPTNMAQVSRFTRDYLFDLRQKVSEVLENDGDLAEAFYVDQERWRLLDTFEELAKRNAGRVFEEMEFE
jgi:glyoxylase-like metal-dependent hydrolase (beta-lactamase superfamily II)